VNFISSNGAVTLDRPNGRIHATISRTELMKRAEAALLSLEHFMEGLKMEEVPDRKPQPIRREEQDNISPPGTPQSEVEEAERHQHDHPRRNYTTTDQAARKGNPKCPECGDETVLRTRRSNGSEFYGCINYPTCRATIDAKKAVRQ
jgi:hypothetical protein